MLSTRTALPPSEQRRLKVTGLRVLGQKRLVQFHDLLDGGSGPLSVGRTRQRDIRIRHRTVSRLHCYIEKTVEGEFTIQDNDSKNGLYVAWYGPYGEFQRKTWCTLRIGMYIRLGDVIIVPVDQHGESFILAKRHSEFLRRAHALYGTPHQAEDHVGCSRKAIGRVSR
jgi:hypothetical protein